MNEDCLLLFVIVVGCYGYTCLSSVPPLVKDTTTQFSLNMSTPEGGLQSVKIEFHIEANFSIVSNNLDAAVEALKPQLAQLLGVNSTQIGAIELSSGMLMILICYFYA